MGDADDLREVVAIHSLHTASLFRRWNHRYDETTLGEEDLGMIVEIELNHTRGQSEDDGLMTSVPLVHKVHARLGRLVSESQGAIGAVESLHDFMLKEAKDLDLGVELGRIGGTLVGFSSLIEDFRVARQGEIGSLELQTSIAWCILGQPS